RILQQDLAKDSGMVLSTPLKAFLIVAGSTIVVGTGAYLSGALDRFIHAPPRSIAALPQQPPTAAEGASATAGTTPAPADAAQTPSAPAADAQQIVAPTFSLVRAEPDGSVVIAGTATPGAKVEVLAGSTVIAT